MAPPVALGAPLKPGPMADAPAGLYPGEAGCQPPPGRRARHAATQGLLWLVQMEDEPGRYTSPPGSGS